METNIFKQYSAKHWSGASNVCFIKFYTFEVEQSTKNTAIELVLAK